jgi:branched-chain amino acid transport system ATP-binding protein
MAMDNKILEVNHLGITFGGLKAVDDLTFHVKEGEILGLIGPNGAGKSTTFNMLSGALKPTTGEIFYRGEAIQGIKPWKVCKKGVSRTFQKIKVFADMTVLENAMAGTFLNTHDKKIAIQRSEGVLERVGLNDKKDNLAKNLTLADRKKLEIARSLCNDPDLLLVDEMMCGLTTKEMESMMKLLRDLSAEGKTLIVVEHIMAVIMSLSNRLIVLDHGQLIAEGEPKEVGKNERVIEAYLGGHYATN